MANVLRTFGESFLRLVSDKARKEIAKFEIQNSIENLKVGIYDF